MPEISTDELIKKIANHKEKIFSIVDVRSVEAYNGWCLENESRGGHIAGAKSLPFKWTRYVDWIEAVRFKQIATDDPVVIYGYKKEEIDAVAFRFKKSGYQNVSVYYHFLDEWVKDAALEMQLLPRYRQLVSADWVKKLIDGKSPAHYDQKQYKIVHAHYQNRDAYLSGHIPEAIDMDTNAMESMETWNRRSPEELRRTLESHGITHDTTVVLYGKFMHPDNADEFPGSAAGDIGAIRCAFIMIYAGVKDVRILNGGFQSWIDAAYEVVYDDRPKQAVQDFGVEIPQHPELAVDTPEAKRILQSPQAELVCVRSWPEYIGEVSGYNYIEPKGRIPGAVFADCGSDAYHMENYRNFDHTTREFHEIEEIWQHNGITPDKHLAFYCGTGWRGSEAWFNAWLMGWPRVSVYDGGWFEWSADVQNPYETGIPEE